MASVLSDIILSHDHKNFWLFGVLNIWKCRKKITAVPNRQNQKYKYTFVVWLIHLFALKKAKKPPTKTLTYLMSTQKLTVPTSSGFSSKNTDADIYKLRTRFSF